MNSFSCPDHPHIIIIISLHSFLSDADFTELLTFAVNQKSISLCGYQMVPFVRGIKGQTILHLTKYVYYGDDEGNKVLLKLILFSATTKIDLCRCSVQFT